ncbi:MAG: 16S rRNA (cytosine(1402)-N(4))-methyltransferase RsmH [Actinomycetes bacterium]
MTEKSLVEQHIPVMLDRVVELLTPCLSISNPIFVDATLGLAGHTEALLNKFSNLKVIGFDRDPIALNRAKLRLEKYQDRINFINDTFDAIGKNLKELKVNAFLFDLGVSSIQLDESNRGFSYAQNTNLDMRMNQNQDLTAEYIINNYDAKDLTKIIFVFGEEKFASRIANSIIKQRQIKKIETTFELVEIIKSCIPAPARRTGGNPAKRTFQALRIAVNNELEILEKAIPQALNSLAKDGRLIVLSYQSLEDRIAKNIFRETTSTTDLLPGLPIPLKSKEKEFILLNKKAETATQNEIATNPRATSVKLRAIQRIGVAA